MESSVSLHKHARGHACTAQLARSAAVSRVRRSRQARSRGHQLCHVFVVFVLSHSLFLWKRERVDDLARFAAEVLVLAVLALLLALVRVPGRTLK